MADEDIVEFNFKGSTSNPPPSPSKPSPPPFVPERARNDGPSLEEIEAWDKSIEASEAAFAAAQELQDTINALFDEAHLENKYGVQSLASINKMLLTPNPDSGNSIDSLSEVFNSLAREATPRREGTIADIAEVFKESNDQLIAAIEKLAAGRGGGGGAPRTPKVPTTPKAEESFFAKFSRLVIRPAAQASFTPTLFRNNLERTTLGVLQKVASGTPSVAASTAQLAASAKLSASAASAATTVATLASGAAAATAGLILFGTSIVAGASAIDAAVSKIANTIIEFSPEVAIADAQRNIQRIQDRRDRAAAIGSDVASMLLEAQDVESELTRLVTNIYALLDSWLTRGFMDAAEGVLSIANAILEKMGGVDNSLSGINRKYQQKLAEEFAEEAQKRGLDQMALRFMSQVDAEVAAMTEEVRANAALKAQGMNSVPESFKADPTQLPRM